MRHLCLALLSLLFLISHALAKRPHISDVIEGEKSGRPSIARSKPKTIKDSSAAQVMKSAKSLRRQSMDRIREAGRRNPQVKNLYDKTKKTADDLKGQEDAKTGMNLALKRLAADFERQFLKMMWQHASVGVSGESFSDNVWQSQWQESIIEAGTEMGDIGWAVYEELAGEGINDNGANR